MMESIVNCPECGEQVQVVMEPYQEAASGLMKLFEEEIGKTSHFQGQGKCGCGKLVIVSLHVTAGGV
jgi:hypothetical protein